MKKGLILGFFDGVHLGHQAVISSALDKYSILITFKESPAQYFNQSCEYILSRENSLNKIKSLGVNEIVELDFSQIAKKTAEEYLQFVIEKYSPQTISTGFNHTFGVNKKGNSSFLELNQERYKYNYICTHPQIDEGEIISSSLIKKLLKEGEIIRANKLLGSNFILEGTVVKGAQLGRKLGFPTANITYPKNIVKIPYGVYMAKVLGHKAILNWGIKPTVANGEEPILEVHIMNFEKDLYNKFLQIEILQKIRNEQKFDTIEQLKEQVRKDIQICLEL